jgi:hypothetical protein
VVVVLLLLLLCGAWGAWCLGRVCGATRHSRGTVGGSAAAAFEEQAHAHRMPTHTP